MLFYDIESSELVTLAQLKEEYNRNRKAQPEEFNYDFADYIRNCLTENNGTLEIIREA